MCNVRQGETNLAEGWFRCCSEGFVRAITEKTVINHGGSGESEATDKGIEGRGENAKKGMVHSGVRTQEREKEKRMGKARKVGTKEIYHRGYLDVSRSVA